MESGMGEVEQWAREDRVSSLMGVVNTATAAIVAELAVVLAAGAWAVPGVRSKEHYVCWQTGVSAARAKRLITIAERWGELPECEARFAAGSLGEDAMSLIARHVPAERDHEVAVLAPMMTYSQLQVLVRIRPQDPTPKPEREPATRFWDDEDDGFQLRVSADHDEGALLKRALEAARDDLFHLRYPDAHDRHAAAAVSWHEAMTHLAETALNAFDPAVQRGGRASDRYQVLVHLDRRTIDDPVATLHLGPVIRDSLARYLACDASVRTVIWDGERLVGINPRTRTVPDRLRKIIEQRDGRCRVPGCSQTRWLHVHHLRHVEDGGLTVPGNLCCLCPYHHRLHHAGLLQIEGDPETPDGLKFFDARGRPLEPPRPHPPNAPPDQPPTYLNLPTPAFTRPLGETMDWRTWWWDTIPGHPS